METDTVVLNLPDAPKTLVTPEDSPFRTNTYELISVTNELAKVVSEVCHQINGLKEERGDAVGETRDAYTLVIKNKVWTLQALIGAYWRKTLDLDLDKMEASPVDSLEVSETFIDSKKE
jgi:hypothetical protein